jgi:hypothetical protein
MKKFRLPSVALAHTHNLGDGTAEAVHGVARAGAEIADKVASAAENIANAARDVAKPVADGTGELLSAISSRLRIKQSEINGYRNRALALAQEVERLKARKINSSEMTAQLKLALIEISQSYPSFVRKALAPDGKALLGDGGLFPTSSNSGVVSSGNSSSSGGDSTEYVSLRTATYKVHIGVDLERLSFVRSGDNRILAYGLRDIQIIGLKGLKNVCQFSEIRQTYKSLLGKRKIEILVDHSELSTHSEEHHRKVLEEIQDEQSIEHLIEPNARFALAFLNAIFSASGHVVEESSEPLDGPLKFAGLCNELNRLMDARVTVAEEELREIDTEVKAIEHSMLSLTVDELVQPTSS